MTASKIEWTDRSDWNPLRGCTRVSPGCGGPGKHGGCYAEAMAARFSKPGMWGHGFAEMVNHEPRWTGKVELQEDRLLMPLSWKKSGKVFPNSTSDFFHEKLTDAEIDKLFAVMALCPHLTFQVLTKRPERMLAYLMHPMVRARIAMAIARINARRTIDEMARGREIVLQMETTAGWPLPNVWLGVSAERQQEADERIALLVQTPAAIRFVSCEPLLGPITLRWAAWDDWCDEDGRERTDVDHLDGARMLDWIIAGGESGPRARPMHPDWARSLRDECAEAGVPFFFKQWGEWRPFTVEPGGDLGGEVRAGRVEIVHPSARSGVELLNASGGTRQTEPGSRYMARMGKAHTGAVLDGQEHKAFPEPRP